MRSSESFSRSGCSRSSRSSRNCRKFESSNDGLSKVDGLLVSEESFSRSGCSGSSRSSRN